jgi:hypothetical protein
MRKTAIIAVLAVIILLGGCGKAPQTDTSVKDQLIGSDIADISFFFEEGEEIRISIPFMVKNKTEEWSFAGIKDLQIPGLTAEVFLDEEYKGISLGSIFLIFNSPGEEISADTVFLKAGDKIIEYRFGKLYSKHKENYGTFENRLFFFSRTVAQAPLAVFTENLCSMIVYKTASLDRISFSSDEIAVIEESVEKYYRKYAPDDHIDIQMKLNGQEHKYYKFGTCLEGTDLATGEKINEYSMILTDNDEMKMMKKYIDEKCE